MEFLRAFRYGAVHSTVFPPGQIFIKKSPEKRTCPDRHHPLTGPNCSNDAMTLANSPPIRRPRCDSMHVYTPDVTSSPTSLRPCAAGSAQQIKVECGLL
ncbi:hypothetical protein TNCT_686081 [Trichonephila clavata]|uniref:Uncharacterized protein n=1 Tax=Trichonephila clavata TaxID=2740835 RepID=A0A8X6JB48_TRICU|nr:hypothetical protein TNCT_686081 [Trichonephila clavata]